MSAASSSHPDRPSLLTTRDTTLDALRGLAALMVIWDHMLHSKLPGWETLTHVKIGRAGVQLFFMISGYVICALLLDSRARWSDAAGFMARRMARLAPPYFGAVLATVALLFMYEHIYPAGDFMQPRADLLLCSLTYTCYPLDLPLYVAVGWTLEIEVQFYLISALFLPAVVRWGAAAGWSIAAGLIVASVFVPHVFAVKYAAPFIIGMVLVGLRRGALNFNAFLALTLLLSAFWSIRLREWETGVVLVLGTLALAKRVPMPKSLIWLGGISYSLYLVHAEAGPRLLAILRKLGMPMDGGLMWLWAFVCTGIAIAVAALAHRLVERPSIRLSHTFGRPASIPPPAPVPSDVGTVPNDLSPAS